MARASGGAKIMRSLSGGSQTEEILTFNQIVAYQIKLWIYTVSAPSDFHDPQLHIICCCTARHYVRKQHVHLGVHKKFVLTKLRGQNKIDPFSGHHNKPIFCLKKNSQNFIYQKD